MIQLLKLATISVLLLLSATAQTTNYAIPSTGCGVYIDQCIIYWPGELMSLNESQHHYQPNTPPSSWSIFNIDSYDPVTGFTLLHDYHCLPNTAWKWTQTGTRSDGGTIGTVNASCSGTDSVTGSIFTMTYTINAYSYKTRYGLRWWVTGGSLALASH
jgi:hypothetical protein